MPTSPVSYQVFARKYRPQNFDEVVGQGHIVRTLKNAIEQNRLAHAYLFVGPRGTGKTSTARILAKALNCVHGPTTKPCGECPLCVEIAEGRSLNVLEFDAASNTGVDKVRELIIENVKYAPASGQYKLYIVDEVHMLSTSSFNALLKTLEEPPSHVIFIFATTDPQKVPLTIISRCQRFDLRRIPTPLIEQHLQFIAGKEGITLAPVAAQAIARGAEGGLRDAESMLDQLVAFCGSSITEEDVLSVFGFTAQETVSTMCGAMLAGQTGQALEVLQGQAEKGKDLSRLMTDVIGHLRDLLVMKADPEGLRADVSEGMFAQLEEQSGALSTDRLLELIEQFAAAETRMKWASNKKLHFEVAIIKAVQTLEQATLSEILDTLTAIRGGGELPARTGPPAGKPPLPRAAPRKIAAAEEPGVARAIAPVISSVVAPAVATVIAPKAEPRQPDTVSAEAEKPVVAAEPVSKVSEGPGDEVVEPIAKVVAEHPVAKGEVTEMLEVPSVPVAEAARNEEPVDVTALWTDVLVGVRKERPLISTWLEAGMLLGVDERTVRLGFPPAQRMAMDSLARPNNRTFLEKLFAGLTGQKRELVCEAKEGLVVTPANLPPPEPEPKAADPMEEFKNDPLIRRALEIFQAEIQPA